MMLRVKTLGQKLVKRPMNDSQLRWLFIAITAVNIIPIIIVRHVPAVDLPNHVLAAAVAINKAQYYPQGPLTFKFFFSPYILFTVIITALLPVFGKIWATKIVLLAYSVGLPLSVLKYIKAFNQESWPLAFLIFPFVYSYHFEFGLIQYCIGIPLVFLALAYSKKLFDRTDTISVLLIISILAIAIYFSHWVDFLAFSVGFTAKYLSLIIRHKNSINNRLSKIDRTLIFVKSAAIFMAPLIFFGIYLSQVWRRSQMSHLTMANFQYKSILWQIIEPMRTLFSNSLLALDIIQIFILAALIILAFMIRKRRPSTAGGVLPFGLIMLLLATLIPGQAFLSSWSQNSRFVVFAFVPIIACISLPYGSWRNIGPIVMTVLVVVLTIFRAEYYIKTDRIADEYLGALKTVVGSGKNVYNLLAGVPDPRPGNLPVFMHTISYFHVDSGGYSPFLFDFQPYVSGLSADIDLPKGPEYSEWEKVNPKSFYRTLSRWDYLAVMHCGQPVPDYIKRLQPLIKYSGPNCTIYTTTGITDLIPEDSVP